MWKIKIFQMFLASLKNYFNNPIFISIFVLLKAFPWFKEKKVMQWFFEGVLDVYCRLYFSVNRELLFSVNSLGNSPWFTYKGKVDGH